MARPAKFLATGNRQHAHAQVQQRWTAELDGQGFVLVTGAEMLQGLGGDGPASAGSLLELGTWEHLGDDGDFPFRKRAYSRLAVRPGHDVLISLPPKLFSLPEEENAKLGAKRRRFAPAPDDFLAHPALRRLVWRVYDALPLSSEQRAAQFHVGLHLLRILEDGTGEGLPTPEGIHQDGARFVAVTFLRRQRVRAGSAVSSVYTLDAINGETAKLTAEQHQHNDSCRLLEYEMAEPFETLLLNDRRVKHAVTGLELDRSAAGDGVAVRDMLVMTFMSQRDDEEGIDKVVGKY